MLSIGSMLIVVLMCSMLRTAWTSCDIERIYLTNSNMLHSLPDVPVIYVMSKERNAKVVNFSSKEFLETNYGGSSVILSSSNTYSSDKRVTSLKEYLHYMEEIENSTNSADEPSNDMEYQREHSHLPANETFYLFGNNYDGVWQLIADAYVLPPFVDAKKTGAVTVGLGGYGSGVGFHVHGPGFSEVLIGSKRWFLYPPDTIIPEYHPNITMVEWLSRLPYNSSSEYLPVEDLNGISNHAGYSDASIGYSDTSRSSSLIDCTIVPGEVLYFPYDWPHATLNEEPYNVFMSTFIDLQLL